MIESPLTVPELNQILAVAMFYNGIPTYTAGLATLATTLQTLAAVANAREIPDVATVLQELTAAFP
ncbi:MAG: hypothetical protein RL120_17340, partial [Gammaproteobacteria bacterium]